MSLVVHSGEVMTVIALLEYEPADREATTLEHAR
jgi:hypothetical protein